LVRLAKLRWRIEHDYREMKQALGLAHFEGRTWNGWHHHVTLVSTAHAFCALQRLARAPKSTSRAPASSPVRREGITGRAAFKQLALRTAAGTDFTPDSR
jgi:hypothetical protein